MKRRVFMIGAGMVSAASILSCTSKGLKPQEPHTAEGAVLNRADTIKALRPPKRKRPLVAVLADNQGSETTDLIVPWSVLNRSDAADVVIVSTQSGDVKLMPALKIQSDMALDEFDVSYKTGADYVIVPAFHNPKNLRAKAWLQQQSGNGATIAGVCSGALVLAHAGLLADRRATTHWFDRKRLVRISPTTKLQLNNRYLADRGIATTTGVSASLPFALTLVEAILGKPYADETANRIGISDFGQGHNSAGYQLKAQNVLRLASNYVSGHEEFAAQIAGGVDEMALAFIADAWSRTYRSRVLSLSDKGMGPVVSANGLRIVPDVASDTGADLQGLPAFDGLPAHALAFALAQIAKRYGAATANLVALQLEYDWSA